MDIIKFKDHCDCISRYLEENQKISEEIKSYLTNFLIVSFYSEMEERIKSCIEERFSFVSDEEIKSFLLSRKYHNGLAIKDIKETIKRFSKENINKFNPGEELETSYSNIIRARHGICHDRQLNNMTLSEIFLKDYFKIGNTIISEFRKSLNLP